MEENKPKRERIAPKPIAKSPKPTAPEKDEKILDLAAAGFNANQIGAMLQVHTQYVKELLAKQ